MVGQRFTRRSPITRNRYDCLVRHARRGAAGLHRRRRRGRAGDPQVEGVQDGPSVSGERRSPGSAGVPAGQVLARTRMGTAGARPVRQGRQPLRACVRRNGSARPVASYRDGRGGISGSNGCGPPAEFVGRWVCSSAVGVVRSSSRWFGRAASAVAGGVGRRVRDLRRRPSDRVLQTGARVGDRVSGLMLRVTTIHASSAAKSAAYYTRI